MVVGARWPGLSKSDTGETYWDFPTPSVEFWKSGRQAVLWVNGSSESNNLTGRDSLVGSVVAP